MTPIDALRHADPAKRLGTGRLDDRDEQLLREILATPSPASATEQIAPARARGGSSTPDRRARIATVVVALAVVVAAVVAIRLVPSSPTSPAGVTSPSQTVTEVLTEAVFTRLDEVATGDVPVREKSAITWTDARPGSSGGGIDNSGKSLFVAAACEGGGSIAIRISGRADTDLGCDGRSTIGPIDVTALVGARETASLEVVTTTGSPRYVAKAMAFAVATPPVSPVPTAGQILGQLTSADGREQTRSIAANGAALSIDYSCTGDGTIAITVAGGPTFSMQKCTGPGWVSSATAVDSTVPVTVRSTGDATWSVTVVAADPK